MSNYGSAKIETMVNIWKMTGPRNIVTTGLLRPGYLIYLSCKNMALKQKKEIGSRKPTRISWTTRSKVSS